MKRIFQAPAKINLCLHVLGRRPDGYHELAMLMQKISLYDTVALRLVPRAGVRVACAGVPLPPGEENIAAQAARSMLQRAGEPRGVEIEIDKRIPVAAGLGGGSSDAAAVLLGLNEMLELELGRDALMAEGLRLGADVPFFLFPGAAWATGVGERLEEVPLLPPLWYVLVNPGFAVSTAWVYGNLGLTSPGDGTKLPEFHRNWTGEGVVRLLHNDLEPVTAGRYPVVTEVKERLQALGAEGALMSGSGPTVFGVFASEEAARSTAAQLEGEASWQVFVAQPV